jgi:hypothetical protein
LSLLAYRPPNKIILLPTDFEEIPDVKLLNPPRWTLTIDEEDKAEGCAY